MGLIQRLASRMGYERRAYNPNDTWGAFQALRTGNTDPEGISAVYACVQAISETVASLPLILFKRDGEDSTRASPAEGDGENAEGELPAGVRGGRESLPAAEEVDRLVAEG